MSGSDPAATPATPAAFRHWGRWFWPVALSVLVLDQLTKWWLFALPGNTRLPTWILPAQNSGVAWSIGHQWPWAVTLVTALLLPALAWVWWRWFRPLGAWENLAFGGILGGALGNGFDRACARLDLFHLRGVRDFINIDLGFWPAHPWPTFNIADAGITGGFLVLVALTFRKPKAATAHAGIVAVSDR